MPIEGAVTPKKSSTASVPVIEWRGECVGNGVEMDVGRGVCVPWTVVWASRSIICEVEAVAECHEPMIVWIGDIVQRVLVEEKSCNG